MALHAQSVLLLSCLSLSAAFTLHQGDALALSLMQTRASFLSNASSSPERPHIVFILADDLGWNGVGFNAGEKGNVKTPAIDKLANAGVILDAYYAGPYCAPSRFSLLTGRTPWKSEAGYMNFRGDTPIGTDLSYTMLPAALKNAGYSTHMIGKWHQGFHMKAYLPTERGFDTAFGILTGCTHHFTQEVYENGNAPCTVDGHQVLDLQLNGEPATAYRAGEYSDDLYRHHAMQLIASHDLTKPLFLYLSLQLPHSPFEVDVSYSKKYNLSADENVFWGMHSHVDDTVKGVVEELVARKMYANTLIIFTSDNGAENSRHVEPFFANYPLRGHKGTLYEGGIRVPCFVSGGIIPLSARGRKLKEMMGVEDWYATLAHVTGHALDNGGPKPHDSLDNWEYLIGASNNSIRKEMVQNYFGVAEGENYHNGVRMSVIRNGRYKALGWGTSVLPDDCHGCRKCSGGAPCIYDMDTDAGETVDLYDELLEQRPEYVKYLIERMDDTWKEAYAQSFFGVDRPGNDEATFSKACSAFKKQGGFLGPWATHDDEVEFTRREFAFKLELDSAAMLSNNASFYYDFT